MVVDHVRIQKEALQNNHNFPISGLRDRRTYDGVVKIESAHTVVKESNHQLVYDVIDKVALKRFSSAYVKTVVFAGSTYNIQYVFDKKGYFGIRVTPLGARSCLLEDRGGEEL